MMKELQIRMLNLMSGTTLPQSRKEARIDPKILDEYVGQYELRPGFLLNITREADKLWGQAGTQIKAELFAESETRFFFKIADVQITFVKDASGKVTHLVLHQSGDHEAKKVK